MNEKMFAIVSGNLVAAKEISYKEKYIGNNVEVVGGKKIPIGTKGKCFWVGCKNYSHYPDPYGVYTVFRVGLKDDDGNVFFTSINNIRLV